MTKYDEFNEQNIKPQLQLGWFADPQEERFSSGPKTFGACSNKPSCTNFGWKTITEKMGALRKYKMENVKDDIFNDKSRNQTIAL